MAGGGGGAIGELVVKFSADIADILTNTERIKKQLEGTSNSVTASVEGIKSTLKRVAEGFAVWETLKHTVVASVEAFAEVEAAQIRLQATLEATGNTAGTSVARIKAFADELSSFTTYSDDEIINAAANLAKYTQIQGDSFERTIRDAANLAAITGGPLSEAANTLGRAMENAFAATRLRRVGLLTDAEVELMKALHDAGLEAERQQALLEAIESRSAGAAATVGGQGLASAFQQLKNAVNNAGEEIGEYISKAAHLEEALRLVTEVIRHLIESGDLAKWALEAALGLTIIKETFVALGNGAAAVVASFIALVDGFAILGKAAQGASEQIAGALLVVSGNVAAGQELIQHGSQLINTLPGNFQKLTEDLKVAGTAWDGFWNDKYDVESESIRKQLAELDKAGPQFAAKAKAFASGIGSAPTNAAGFTEAQQQIASYVSSLDDVPRAANAAGSALQDAANNGKAIGEGADGVRSLGDALADAAGKADPLVAALEKIHESEVKADAEAIKLAAGGVKALDDFGKKSQSAAQQTQAFVSAMANSERAAKILNERAAELGISVDTLVKKIVAVQAAPQIAQAFSAQLKAIEDAHRTTLTNIEAEAAKRRADLDSQLKEVQFLRDAKIIGEQEFIRRRSDLVVAGAQRDYDVELAKQQDLIKKVADLQAQAARAPTPEARVGILSQIKQAQDAVTKSTADLYVKQVALDDATKQWGRDATLYSVKVAEELNKIADGFSRSLRSLDDMIDAQARANAQIGLTREQVAGLNAEYEATRRIQDILLELEKRYAEAVGAGRTLETALKPEAAQALKAYIEQVERIAPGFVAAQRAAAQFNEAATAALNNQITAWQSVLDEAETVFDNILDHNKNTIQQLADYIKTTLRKALFDLVAKQWIIPIITNISGGAVAGGLADRLNTSLAQNPLARAFGYAPAEVNIKNLGDAAARASVALVTFANQLPSVVVGAINRVVPSSELASALGSAESTFDRMATDTSQIAESMRSLIADASSNTATSIAELTASVNGVSGSLSAQVASVSSAVEAAAAAARSTAESTTRTAVETFSHFSTDAEGVMASVATDVRVLAAGMLESARQVASSAGGGASAFGLTSLGSTIADSTRSVLTGIASDNLAVTESIAADISDSTNSILNSTTTYFDSATNTMSRTFKDLTTSTTDTFRGLAGATATLFGGMTNALVTVLSGLGSLGGGAGGALAAGGGLLRSLFSGVGGGGGLTGFLGEAIFGAGSAGATALSAGFSAGLSTLGIAASAGTEAIGGLGAAMGALGAVAIPLIPVFALALPLISGLFSRPSGPKTGGFAETGNFTVLPTGERYFTPSDADKQATDVVSGISTSINNAVTTLGGNLTDLGIGFGYDIDKQGTAQSRVSAGVSVAGQTVFSQRDVGAGRSDQELQAGIETEAARAVLAAVQNSNLPTYLANILNTVVAATATKDQATAIIQTAEAAKVLVDTLSKALSPEQVERFNTALTAIDFSKVTNPIKAVVEAGFAELAPAFTPILESFRGTDEELTKFATTLVGIATATARFSDDFKNNITKALNDATQATADKVAAFVTIFTQFGDAITGLGPSLEKLDPASITAFIDALGGAQQAVDKLNYIYQNFTTSAQRHAAATARLTADFNELGITAIPQTHEQFLALLNSFDKTTDAGRAMYNSVAALAPLFVEVAGTADQAAQALENQARSGTDLYYSKIATPAEQTAHRIGVDQASISNIAGFNTVLSALNLELPKSVTGIRQLVNAVIAKYGAESAEAQAVFAAVPALYDMADAAGNLGDAAQSAADAISKAWAQIDEQVSAFSTKVGNLGDLAGQATDFRSQLETAVNLYTSQLATLRTKLAAAWAANNASLASYVIQPEINQLLPVLNAASAELARFNELSAQYGDSIAEQLLKLEEWLAKEKKLFAGDPAALDTVKTIFQQKWDAIIKGTTDAGTGVGNALNGIIRQIRQFVDNLKTGDLSTLKPTEKLAVAQEAFNKELAAAQSGNQDALQSITQYANDYLTQARNVYASSTAYGDIFSSVVAALTALADSTVTTTNTIAGATNTITTTPTPTPLPTPTGPAPLPTAPLTSTTAATTAATDSFTALSTSLDPIPAAAAATSSALGTLPAPLASVTASSTQLTTALSGVSSALSSAVGTVAPAGTAAGAVGALPNALTDAAAGADTLTNAVSGLLGAFSSFATAVVTGTDALVASASSYATSLTTLNTDLATASATTRDRLLANAAAATGGAAGPLTQRTLLGTNETVAGQQTSLAGKPPPLTQQDLFTVRDALVAKLGQQTSVLGDMLIKVAQSNRQDAQTIRDAEIFAAERVISGLGGKTK